MAYDNDQREPSLPAGNENYRRKTENHLPRYFRTNFNSKFLSATLDQLIQPGIAEKLNGYLGRKTAKAFHPNDNYVGGVTPSRENYQLEPATIIKDDLGNVDFYKDYNDYINQVKNFGGSTSNHSKLNAQEYYAWNPHIDWDKFVNFREYYWLPNGPDLLTVVGQSKEITSTFSIDLQDNADNISYLFTPDGKTSNPSITLYRGQTYRFEVNTPNFPIAFATRRTWTPGNEPGEQAVNNALIYDTGITKFNIDGKEIDDVWIDEGVIEFTVPETAPDTLHYISENDPNTAGLIKIFDIIENTKIDVEKEILGKKTYVTGDGYALSNGMKIEFAGNVTPEKYASGEWFVEGVGDSIKLISQNNLTVSGSYTGDIQVEFDQTGFDFYPFSEALGYPTNKDYIVINRATNDGNLWSRYNRWFHKSVIEESARINSQVSSVDESARAKRPIIEFDAGLKLFNFGTNAKLDVDLVDTFTKDVFSTIEGSAGYNVDGIDLSQGMRVLFTADTDIRVTGKIYKVNFITHNNRNQISLIEETDGTPLDNETVLVKAGNKYAGKFFYYNNSTWKIGQEKTKRNQPPLFDLFDKDGTSYSDADSYDASTFAGNKLFSYQEGSGTVDTELDFALQYRSIANTGDIVFNFDLLNNNFTYQIGNDIITVNTDTAFLQKYNDRTNYASVNGWIKADNDSTQNVLRQYVFDNSTNQFEIDVYNEIDFIDNVWLRVYLNNKLQFINVDFEIVKDANNKSYVQFTKSLALDDIILIKTRSQYNKNSNGLYEIASNLEKNPLNNNINQFTLGEVNDHVSTIVEELNNFSGVYPGASNLRDTGQISKLGKKFLKHSGPINLSLYHLLDKEANVVQAIRYAKKEYRKFKRQFLEIANTLGFEGETKIHVDKIITELNKDKVNTMPFYFSDMIPYSGAIQTNHTVLDSDEVFFPLSQIFSLEELSRKAVNVYLNNTQLLYGIDYTFNDEGFAVVTATKAPDDIISIYEYESTNGSYVPPTPTKLGLYPKYDPKVYIDDTYLTPTKIVQGHDGSKTVAFDDFRDDLLLELEKRIFNNIKIKYDTNLFDINDFVSGEHRDTGFTKTQIDSTMSFDFLEYNRLVDGDFVTQDYFLRENSFTFNYSQMNYPTGGKLPGWWRQVYKQAYDTDRPHLTPWEMLGFSIKPIWWEDQYGPAPYTRDNLVLWQDLEKGIIREPNKPIVVAKKYVRPGLVNHIPVDSQGTLLSPSESGYASNFSTSGARLPFKYGDGSPVESSWRSSSDYPFAIITSWLLNQPNKVMSTGFDRARQIRNSAGQIVYSATGKQVTLKDIVFPNSINDTTQIYTSGLINYVANYLTFNTASQYTTYKENLFNIENQIGAKIAGYTEKEKFKLILDSRTPLNEGNVFIPDENYSVFLNTSSPIDLLSYSGVLIEKTSSGYIVSGYDTVTPSFKYFKPIPQTNDPYVTVGGISESFVDFDGGRTYAEGSVVRVSDKFYRAKETHTSGAEIDAEKFVLLPQLPVVGGKTAQFRRIYETKESVLEYGVILSTLQDVVDFLQGYGAWLESKGFIFEEFVSGSNTVSDWRTTSKQFMFWTTQNWGQGSVITLSPAAEKIKFKTDYAIVDNVFDTFYGYSVLKADGKKLKDEYLKIYKESDNTFSMYTVNTADGIYAVRLPLVQKEHVVLLDNTTVFGDVIYDLEPGYRQERIKVLGYRTDNWNGSLNIPGFIFDNARPKLWEPWTDYTIGDLVKYKEFYYSADKKIAGKEFFNANDWNRLSEEPTSRLLTNFDYKINQFADFYDLDSDNFDTEQQRLAQHLIGYQKRQYLENIINDDVSQYKFYQGFIQDKGTKNALTKLFDALASADKDSLEFYEEWAIKDGQYGASEGFEEVEYLLDEKKFRLTPQPILLTNNVTGKETDLIYRIQSYETYLKPKNYNHRPLPAKYIDQGYTKNSGYVNPEDVSFVLSTYDDILTLNLSDVTNGAYVWVGNVEKSWNVYKHINSELKINKVISGTEEFSVELDTTAFNVTVGDILGVFDIITTVVDPADSTQQVSQTTAPVEGFFKVKKVSLNKITFETSQSIADVDDCTGILTKFVSVRADTLSNANKIAEYYTRLNDKIWVDDDTTGKWLVLENKNEYNELQALSNTEEGTDHNYGISISADERNSVMVVGAPNNADGKVLVYSRASNANNWVLRQVIEADSTIADAEQNFGKSVDVSADGKYLIVGAPNASNVKTNFKGDYVDTQNYQAGEIVRRQDSLWQADFDILGAEANIQFDSFQSVPQIIDTLNLEASDAEDIPFLLAGNYPFTNQTTDHFLIRAPKTMYDGTGLGDEIVLHWNSLANANQDQDTLVETEPFANTIPYINKNYLESAHTVFDKIDAVLYVDTSTNIPSVGSTISTIGATATVAYTYNEGASVTIYVKDVNGTFPDANSLTIDNGDFVGEYERVGPIEETSTSTVLGGFWLVKTSTPYQVGEVTSDIAGGLIFKDVIPDSTATGRVYFNSLDYSTNTISSEDTLNNFLQVLSFNGAPGPGGTTGPVESQLYVMRAPKDLTDNINPGDQIYTYVNNLAKHSDGALENPSSIGLNFATTNAEKTVYDVWDGYINYKNQFFLDDEPFEPVVGQTVRDVTTGAEAEVAYYIRNLDDVTIFVKNVTGTWSKGDQFGQAAEIEMLAYPGGPDPDAFGRPGIYGVDRKVGVSQRISLGYSASGIGKLLVFQAAVPISAPTGDYRYTSVLGATPVFDSIGNFLYLQSNSDFEIWFYNVGTVLGIPRLANIPAGDNLDWTEVFKIPTSVNGTSEGYVNEGIYYIYERNRANTYVSLGSFVGPQRQNNNYLGTKVEIRQTGNLYRGFISAPASETVDNPGRIYFIKNGFENGETYNWDYAKDKNFKGEFSESQRYFTGNKVYLANRIYTAITNVNAGPFDTLQWTSTDDLIDYVGFVPNDTGLVVITDSSYVPGDVFDPDNILPGDSTVLDQGSLYDFATAFDVSASGDVLVVSAKYGNDKPNLVVIYRVLNGQYLRDQTITAPNNFIGFGDSVSISSDGRLLAISAPFDDSAKRDQGKVFVYKQQSGKFVQTQILNSPFDESAEQFGNVIQFDGDTLAVNAQNTDTTTSTTFDNKQTTFDDQFTKFNYENENGGTVYVYERINDNLIYAQNLDFESQFSDVNYFGRNLYLKNNHIYVGLPTVKTNSTYQGTIVDYRKLDNSTLFNKLREPKDTIDLSKIKRAILYNTETNQLLTYLDYIDPIQGKIAGPAEQDISYKLYYDPATYTVGPDTVNVNETNSWGPEQVGKIWWNLNNAKFYNPYQSDIIYSTANWSKLFEGNSIDIYEWVQSSVLPSEWDTLSGTDRGVARGITGTSVYGDTTYVSKRKFDSVSQTFSNIYYFWVKDKRTVPDVEFRSISARDIANLIADPQGQGYRYAALVSPDSFVLYNCESLIEENNVAVSFQYYTIDDQTINTHNQYQIITDGLATSTPNRDIERKWIDSLVGYDEYDREVPATNLSPKEKYGILNSPRQSWFVNRAEALKQLIERVNGVLKENLIVDDKNLTKLNLRDPEPSTVSNLYDTTVDSVADLQFIGVAKAEQAKLNLVVENGKVVRVLITDPGRGYRTVPTYTIDGAGSGLELAITIDNFGSISGVKVTNQGKDYTANDSIEVRKFTALVLNDETIQGKWALYERDTNLRLWQRISSQSYDVSLYWDYIDWYATGYSEFTKIDYVISDAYQLQSLDDVLGDVVKIENIGSGGWLLLRKIDVQNDVDYTVNYETIGRQNGTVSFKNTLYDTQRNQVGFDVVSYDIRSFDSLPTVETRTILDSLKTDIFTEELAIEYNKLFFASLRYVFSEQNYVDWAFKTSFIKARHNVGELRVDNTFNNDNLSSYEDYINEVKPFKTKLREYVSAYEKVENSNSRITDFDLQPSYNEDFKKILPQSIKVVNNSLIGVNDKLDSYPFKNWADNVGFNVVAVEIADGGMGYQTPPVLTFSGGGGSGAKAIAKLGTGGKITSVEITSKGTGYISAPTLSINGSISDGGKQAKLSVILGEGLPKTIKTEVKFDRTGSRYFITNLTETESFVGTGSRYIFDLVWPMQVKNTDVSVTVNNIQLLRSEYTFENVKDLTKGYTRYFGRIILTNPAVIGTSIVVEYKKDITLLHAADRINLAYNPETGQFAKDLGQLMDGVDYGGVEVKSFEFLKPLGWESNPWGTGTYDTYDETYLDEEFVRKFVSLTFNNNVNALRYANIIQDNTNATGVVSADVTNSTTIVVESSFDINFTTEHEVRFDDSTLISNSNENAKPTTIQNYVKLKNPLDSAVVYNVYKNGVRIDDPNFGTLDPVTNPNAVMQSLTGDGTTTIVALPDIAYTSTDKIIVRKSTSDGSFLPPSDTYDTLIGGGSLDYSNARGIDSAEINIDGDGFVTPTSSKGPEELVPGQVLDTVDIQVYERPTTGASNIISMNYRGDGVTKVYNIGTSPVTDTAIFVKVDYIIQKLDTDYTIDYDAKTLTFTTAPSNNSLINFVTLEYSGSNVLDIDEFTGDGSTVNFLTNITFTKDNSSLITVDGKEVEHVLVEADNSYAIPGNFVIKFSSAPADGSVIRYAIFEGQIQNYSAVTIDEFVSDGSTTSYQLTQTPFNQAPTEWYTIVKINNTILNAGYNEVFDVTDTREYTLKLWQVPLGSLLTNQIKVYLNNRELEPIGEFTFSSADAFDPTLPLNAQAGSTITLNENVGSTGDKLRVFVMGWDDSTQSGGDYRFGYFDEQDEFVSTPGELFISKNYELDDIITVYQFSNHDSQDIDRQSYDIVERTELVKGINSSVETFIADGSTDSFDLENVLQAGQYYAVYKNNIRIDDPNYGTSLQRNSNAQMQTILGDNITQQLKLDDLGVIAGVGDVFRIEQLKAQTIPDSGTADWYQLRRLRNGVIDLRYPAVDDQYVWVVKNGQLLSPSVDYYVTPNKMTVKLIETLAENDTIETIHFSNDILKNKFGWRQFKDISNRNIYKRLDGSKNFELAEPLNWYDKSIHVVDANELPAPPAGANIPAVIFVEGERIEYFIKDGNYLKQLRRGTFGTGIKSTYAEGTEIYDQSGQHTMPYKDETLSTLFTADGTTKTYELDFTPTTVNEFEVFVAGRRLRKTSIKSYQLDTDLRTTYAENGEIIAQDSPEGDITLPAEFEIQNGNELVLHDLPLENQKVIVIRKKGRIWSELGTRLSDSDTDIARFLRATTVDLP